MSTRLPNDPQVGQPNARTTSAPRRADSRLGWGWRALILGAVLATLAVPVTPLLVHAVARRELARTERAWAEAGESMEAFSARFPAQPDSPVAERLHELTRPLGVRMIWRDEEDALFPHDPDRVLMALAEELTGLEARREAALPPLSSESGERLRQARERLDAIEDLLLGAEPIRWKRDIRLGPAAPIPSLLGQRLLQSLLLGRAWKAALEGRHAAAARSHDASWALEASLADRPELVTKLIRSAVSQVRNAVLRGAPPDASWPARLERGSWSAELHEAYQGEAWGFTRLAVDGWRSTDADAPDAGQPPDEGWGGRLSRFVTAPLLNLSASDVSEAFLEASQQLSVQPCDFDVEAYDDALSERIPRWNALGRMAIGRLGRAAVAIREAALDRELTVQVLRARAARSGGGEWPTRPAPSRTCPAISWEHRPADDGSLTIGASHPPFPQMGAARSWSVTLHP